jgi:HD-GYP domain-containing protein (c-di-GMP phosphodiesterase class II)
VGNLSRKVVGGLVEDRDLLLNLQNLKTEQNYLLGHSLGVTVLSISVATALGYNRKLVLEMGHAAYLHDVGMLKVPGEIVSKPGKLTSMEMMQIRRHPVFGLDMLQRLVGQRSGLAGSIPIVAYQSHERTNGSGYPKRRKGTVVHDFAKIVGVCDAYEAMTSRRSWRQPMLPYKAMEQLVVQASRGEFASDLVKAMLHCVSLFPVGSWVELSDGGTAKVVSSVEQNYTRPVVSVVFRNEQPLEEPERINLAEDKSINIVRPVPQPGEAGDLMEGF